MTEDTNKDPESNSTSNSGEDTSGDNDGSGTSSSSKKTTSTNDVPDSWDGVFEHPRFKELVESKKEAEQRLAEIEKAREEAEEKQLEEKEKFQELAEKRQEKVEQYEQQLQEVRIANAIRSEAAKQGITDQQAIDDAVRLADRELITVKDGSVNGAEDAVKSLVESRPYLKSTSGKDLGTGVNPSETKDGKPIFTMDQVTDPEFYEEHRDEIKKARQEGRIKR